MDVVFLALPNTGSVLADAESNRDKASAKRRYLVRHPKAAAATLNYNALWTDALNSRDYYGLTHFASFHNDIMIGVDFWLDVMIDEMNACGADMISSVVRIKDNSGCTSTGVLLGDEYAGTRRLTMKEIERLPPTFCAADVERVLGFKGELAVNNGIFVCDFTKPWVEHICEKDGRVRGFTATDHIYKDESGLWVAAIDTEDWKFSRWAAEQGLKVFATNKLLNDHEGPGRYRNVSRPDQWDTDEAMQGVHKTREFNQGGADDMSGPVGQKA